MDQYVQMRTESEPLAETGKRGAYPIDSIQVCGDEWCVNGPPGENIETYFLCPECASNAPDAILLGYAVKPATLKPGDRQKINASVMCSFITLRNKITKK